MKIYFDNSNKKERKHEAFMKTGFMEGRLYVFPEVKKIAKIFEKKFSKKNVRIQSGKENRFIITFENDADEAYFLLMTADGLEI